MNKRYSLEYRSWDDTDDNQSLMLGPSEETFNIQWENGDESDVIMNMNRFLKLIGFDVLGYRVVQELPDTPAPGRGDSFSW